MLRFFNKLMGSETNLIIEGVAGVPVEPIGGPFSKSLGLPTPKTSDELLTALL
jgi:hypothetical protein